MGGCPPGTDEVVYYRALDESGETILFRTVAREEAFYAETYRGDGRWEVDSEPFTFLLGGGDLPPPEPSFAIDGRAAALLMRELDKSRSRS
jgi:hypothetical protein